MALLTEVTLDNETTLYDQYVKILSVRGDKLSIDTKVGYCKDSESTPYESITFSSIPINIESNVYEQAYLWLKENTFLNATDI